MWSLLAIVYGAPFKFSAHQYKEGKGASTVRKPVKEIKEDGMALFQISDFRYRVFEKLIPCFREVFSHQDIGDHIIADTQKTVDSALAPFYFFNNSSTGYNIECIINRLTREDVGVQCILVRGGSGIQKMVRPGSGCGHPVMCATSC